MRRRVPSLVQRVVLGALGALAVQSASAAVSPSQVLVLYNAEWTGDAPLTDPGQDSKEIAQHYVRMHTDPASGEEPYLLGLRCSHGKKHLNAPDLKEDSADNGSGVVLRRGGTIVGSAGEMRDSRALEFTLPKAQVPWRFETLRIELRPTRGEPVVLVEAGQSRHGSRVAVKREGGWHVRTDGRSFVPGPFTAWASCENDAGERHSWEAEYQDVLDVSCSRTGADGVRDDRNYMEDVEAPVEAFLQDPRNARPDGNLLKDHVLFLVVCYGLPRTAVATYGIARGVTDRLADHGAIIDLGQRLQVMHYDVEGALDFVPRPHRFGGGDAFASYAFRAPQAWPLEGARANPFLHPLTYRKEKGDLDRLPEPLAFSSANRKLLTGRHLYFSMRVDGSTPLEARGLVDRAVYASRYGGPAMGLIEEGRYAKDEARLGKPHDRGAKVGEWLWGKGFRHLSVRGGTNGLVWLNYLRPGEGFLNRSPVFLPGGVGGTVISHNSWGRQNGEMVADLAAGVTMTAGAARAYGGAPHIHNRSWWDDEILYPFLLRGRTAGEILLMNQIHLEWVATFPGDPLLQYPATVSQDERPPAFDGDRDVAVELHDGSEGEKAVWVRVSLPSEAGAPEVAQLLATGPGGREVQCPTFEGRPYALLGSAADVCGRAWSLETMDPYGNRFQGEVVLDGPACP